MTLQPRSLLFPALIAGCALLPVNSQAQFSFDAHTVTNNAEGFGIVNHADFNGDGREDLFVRGSSSGPFLQLYLSDQNGTYQAPITLSASVDAVGDFNGDGKLDYASFSDNTGGIYAHLGNGDGTFKSSQLVTDAPNGLQTLLAVDLNHDDETDLVTVSNTVTSTGPVMTMQVWLSNGNGTFTKGQTIYPLNQQTIQYSYGLVGDFDGDGKPDIALVYSAGSPTTIQVWYGDGAGHLASPYQITDPDGYSDGSTIAADLNNDGRSDLVSIAQISAAEGTDTPQPALTVFTGNQNRTLSFKKIATDECPSTVVAGDFNGDGINDLAYGESVCDQSSQETNFVVRAGQGSLNFGPEQTEYTSPFSIYDPFVIRSSTGTKPDIVLTQVVTASEFRAELLSNTSTGSFPGCGLSGFAEGVQVCSPGATASSPVQFSIGAAGPTPMRTAAVWADGKKVAEQTTHAFSNYSFLDASVPLATGSHSITVFGTGWDDTLQKKTFTLTVGGSCSAPASAGVHLCQPASGSSVASPVVIQAAARVTGTFARMEVWIDGVKKYAETSGPTLNTTLSLAAGSHRFAVLAINTAGTKWEQAVSATVR